MSVGFDEQINEYLSKEKNLCRLREKLFNLEGYRHQSDIEEEKKQIVEYMKNEHKKALDKLAEDHRRDLQKMKDEYGAEIKEKEKELADFQASVNEALEKAAQDKDELSRWKSGYGDFAEVYANFSALYQKHKDDIAGIFGGSDTPMDFFCGSVQKGHLEQLWDYISDELDAIGMDEQEARKLLVLFDFSFDAVNRSQRDPLFRRLKVNEGAAFDADTMGRTSDSPQLGRVKRLVLAGFAHEVTGSVVRRSLVKLE